MRCGDRPHFDITTTVFENSFRIGLIVFDMFLRALKKVVLECYRKVKSSASYFITKMTLFFKAIFEHCFFAVYFDIIVVKKTKQNIIL